MTIAILAWGALLWDEGAHALKTAPGSWTLSDLLLPLEFSRVSCTRDGALTLVIDPENGVENPTYFVVSSLDNLEEAICNLREREGTGKEENIGFVDCRSGQSRYKLPTASSTIRDWAEKNNFDAVIWTDLPSNFERVVNMKFTVDNAQTYLHGLEEEGAAKAREYIKKAPPEVETPLRQRMCGDPWLDT